MVQKTIMRHFLSTNRQRLQLTPSLLPVHQTPIIYIFVLFLYIFFIQFVVPMGISPMGNSGRFPQGKPAATESRYQALTNKYSACWPGFVRVSIIHITLTWTTG